MCKYLGSFRGVQSVVPLPFGFWFSLAAIPAFLLFASIEAHAQVCMTVNLNDHRPKTISPMYWAPGQNYIVTLTDPAAEFYPGGPTQLYVFDQSEYVPGGPVLQEDPYVTVSPPVYLSPTETSFGVSVDGGAPTEWDGLNFTCFLSGYVSGPYSINITPCALGVTPTLTPTSVQPATWTAGVATNITITGTGFIPTNNPNNCTPTSLYITAGTENIAITNLTVVSSTQITATVQPQITDPAETATVTVSDYQYNNPGVPLTATTTAQIMPNPPSNRYGH
jgi:hypothetical protein